ncbi:MAG: hypothetical protein ABEJ72_03095 [Candidatus Aenigmatarchaeota archaeon]
MDITTKDADEKEFFSIVKTVIHENEEVAEERRTENFASRKIREVKRKLGMRKSGAKKITLQ